MSTFQLTKLPSAELANDLFRDREGELIQVMIRTHDNAAGYWGRGWSVHNAIREAKWLTTGDSVQVFLCSKDARCGAINGGLSHGEMGTIYVGKVTAKHDVRVTHRLDAVK